MHSAKEGEESVVQVESEVYNNCKVWCIGGRRIHSNYQFICEGKVVTSIVAMRGGKDYQLLVDILIPHNHIQADPDGNYYVNFYG